LKVQFNAFQHKQKGVYQVIFWGGSGIVAKTRDGCALNARYKSPNICTLDSLSFAWEWMLTARKLLHSTNHFTGHETCRTWHIYMCLQNPALSLFAVLPKDV
jgi:hypothetical protein